MFRTQCFVVWLGLILFAGPSEGQTRVNLGYQARNVDFGAAVSTRPFKTGTVLPSTCQVGESFFKSDAEPGQNLYGCTGSNQWSLQSGGATAGAGSSAALTDLRAVRTSSTMLTIGSSCSPGTPCNYRMGHLVVSITSPITVTLASATSGGTVFIYLTAANGIVAGHTSTLTVNCSTGCVPQTGVEQFPDESLPLYRWTANTQMGQWDVSGGTDYRAFLSWTPVTAGTGLTRTVNPLTGENSFSVDANIIGVRISVPATSTSACAPGNWAADDQYLYLCASPNVWRRVASESW